MKEIQLPTEIQLRIISFLPEQNIKDTLSRVCLLNRSWNVIATEQLWRICSVDRNNILPFVLGLLSSYKYDLGTHNTHELLDFYIDQMDNIASKIGPQLEKLSNELVPEQFQPTDDAHLPIEGFMAKTNEFQNRLSQSLLQFQICKKSHQPISNIMIPIYGKGYFVKKLSIPSYDPILDILQAIFPFIPNCKSFRHPTHGPEFIPTLQPSLIKHAEKYFNKLNTIQVEDVHGDGWPYLLQSLTDFGYNLKILEIAACLEKGAFISKRGLATVFSHLPKLECLRLEGIPIGSADFSWGGDLDITVLTEHCVHLKAISLDYCDLTLNSFVSIWNNCPNLTFLGVAGLQIHNIPFDYDLNPHHSMQTLRFVDCQITDTLIENATKSAPNLTMLRLVFEYPQSYDPWSPSRELSDIVLLSLAKYCKKLKVLALSTTPLMTLVGFKELLSKTNLQTLDFHCTSVTGSFGQLEDTFFKELIPYLSNIRTLNLFDQVLITEKNIIKLISTNPQLQSLSLNGCTISITLLSYISITNNSINSLSICDCPLKLVDVLWFCDELETGRKKIDRVYSNLEGLPIRKPLVPHDHWFMHQGLDIFSLWSKAIKNSQSNS
ncbi:hypothetical protein BC833DRAFT_623560 [Globomyces pollinis-pini]|nr:hypothetical protein BC833DRAFT_623560 [Globomyces pollinis-pini]